MRGGGNIMGTGSSYQPPDESCYEKCKGLTGEQYDDCVYYNCYQGGKRGKKRTKRMKLRKRKTRRRTRRH